MHDLTILYQLAVIFGVAVVVVLLLGRIGLPGIAGMIISGILLGPNGLGLVENLHVVEVLAEVGVVLLLFTIGMEFSLERLRRIWTLVAIGGGTQVVVTVAAAAGLALALGRAFPQGLFFGFLLALSSTAIVLRALAERGESDAPHGRLILGVLIFQDLCVVPMMLVIPMLGGTEASAGDLLLALGKAAGMVVLVVGGARVVVPRILRLVAAERKRDLFVLTVLLICLGTAWLTSLAGLSLALGAFLAGVVLAGSGYGYQAMSDVLPFRDSFTSLFFISVGMLLDLRVLAEAPVLVPLLFLGILLSKFFIATLAAVVMRFPPRVAILTGMGLAQVGEFSFVLSQTGLAAGLITGEEMRIFLAASVMTMLVTPVLVRIGPHFAASMKWFNPLERAFGKRRTDEEGPDFQGLTGHVIIAGFGMGGQTLAVALKNCTIPYAILELNPATVDRYRAAGEPIFYGDISSHEVLSHMNCGKARELVIMISDPATARRAITAVKQHSREQLVTVRTRYFEDVAELHELGADDVVVEEFESGVELMARVLRRTGTPRNVIALQISNARESRGELVRPLKLPRQRLGQIADMLNEIKVDSYLVGSTDWAVARSYQEIDLRRTTGASVVALRRGERVIPNPLPSEQINAEDVVFLLGEQPQVLAAMHLVKTGIVLTTEAIDESHVPSTQSPPDPQTT